MKISEKYIFLVGTPRSGATVINQSFDGHPEILAWPWEFFYFEWFNEIADGRNLVSCNELNNKLKTFFIDNFTKTLLETEKYHNKNSITIEDLNFGSFDYNNFINLINKKKSEKFTSKDYLHYLFKCLKDSDSRYKNKSVKYYLIHVTARGFDWRDKLLIRSSLLFFSYRNANEVYSSLKKKYDKDGLYYYNLFSLSYKKSILFWFESFKQIDRFSKHYIDEKNFHVIDLKNLQKNTKLYLKEICDSIKISVHPEIYYLTVFGMKTFGHINERGKRQAGKIALQENYELFMFSFEKRLLKSLGLYNYLESKKTESINYNFFQMLCDAIKISLFEIPTNKISINAKSSLFYNLFGRVTILVNLIRIYFLFKNEKTPLNILKKKNSLISENSIFWKNN